ncbi:hypothetical protein ACHAXR_007674 [Thalassiosira sp. AJA248-18]
MKRTCTIVAAAWLAEGVGAFSPTLSSMKSTLTSRVKLRPTGANVRAGILKNSPKETIEAAEASPRNETFVEQPPASLNLVDTIATASPTLSAISTTGSTPDTASTNISPQQQLQEVLSSPELLDPAAVLDATIGIFSDDATDISYEIPLKDDAATDATTTQAIATEYGVAKSKEEDLELTLQTIMRHIDENSINIGVVDDDEEETDEELEIEELGVKSMAEISIENDLEEPALQNTLQVTQQSTVSNTKKSILDSTPSISKILRYTIPAIGIWLCSPVLSMIDTAAVGLLSGTAQQAALNPAVSVTDYGALVVAFMYTATTNLIAAAVQEDKDNGNAVSQPKTTTTLITALKLALLVGSIFGLILGTCGKVLLKLIIGNDSLDPTVFSAALQYVRIRSLGMPAMVVIGTAQSACLGMQDVKSPLYVLLAAAAINFLGDVALVPMSSGVFGGAAGAAWATVASQYAALLFFGRWLTTRVSNDGGGSRDGNVLMSLFDKFRFRDDTNNLGRNVIGNTDDSADAVNVTQGIMELTGTSKAGRSRRKEFLKFLTSSKLSRKIRLAGRQHPSVMTVDTTTTNENKDVIRPIEKKQKQPPKTRGFLADRKLSLRKYLSFSTENFNLNKAKEFLPFVIPVSTTSVGRISGYIAMSHVASSTLGTNDMAGHQIIFSLFNCLIPVVDALNQVAQSFVPAVFEAKEKSAERAMALRKTVNNFRKVGAGFGAVLLGLVACIPLISQYFTTDPIVMSRVNSAIPGVGLFMLVNGLMCAGEGTLLGQKDLKFLRNAYAIFFFTVPAYMLRLKYRALAGLQSVGIGTMWTAFAAYNLIRTSTWHLRLAQLQRRTERGVVEGRE